MKLLLYPHGGSGNHGCEAIVRTTVSMTGAESVLASGAPEEDKRYGLNRCCSVIPEREPLQRFSSGFALAYIRYSLLKDKEALDKLAFAPIFKAAKDCDIALSIGGDNYCYEEPRLLYLINRELRKRGKKTVLWGCSVNPEALKGELLEDLKGYERIVTRESVSYSALLTKGFDNVSLFPDPAFLLKRKETVLPEGFVEGNTVGINVSPLILSYGGNKDIVLSNYYHLVERILKETDMAVSLIPHVVWAKNDDRKPLSLLYDHFKDSGRISFAEDRPAEEMKDLIARCRFVVAARTHATVAAWSECIPTLAVGYSTKAKGIARDLFGDYDAPVITVQSLKDENDISDRFMRIVASEADIRKHLRGYMPKYLSKAAEAKTVLTDLMI